MGIMRLFGINVEAGISQIRIGLKEVEEDDREYRRGQDLEYQEKKRYQENSQETD